MGFNSEAKSGKDQLGWVEVEPVEGEEGGDRRVDQSLYTWRPGPELEFRLPSDFRLDFVCSVGADGARRFEPAKGLNVFLLEASVGGLALLDHVHDLTPEVRFAYHAMRLVFQHARKTHEHLDRSFRRASDLRVMGTDVDVLPDCLGFSALDKSSRWSVAELIRRGRKALMSGGESDVNEERSITAGLLEAARLNPIDLTGWSESEHRILVRLGVRPSNDLGRPSLIFLSPQFIEWPASATKNHPRPPETP